MEEIHGIRRRLANDLRASSWDKWYKKLQADNNRFLKDKGFKLIKDAQGQTKLIRSLD